MKVLFVSNLFPDASEPNRGGYNATLLQHLSLHCEIRVLSPRPTRGFTPFWVPKERFCREQDKIFAPIFPPIAYIPKIGSRFNHLLMARCIQPALRKIQNEFSFDVVLSSWVYPDACATARLAARNNFSFVAVAQGSDVHQYLKIPARRKIIAASLNQASAIISRSQELRQQLIVAGVEGSKVHTIYNGVNSEVFSTAEKSTARRKLGLENDTVIFLFVGNLLPIKNPLLLVEAHASFCANHPQMKTQLLMIGAGPLENAVRERARGLRTGDKVSLMGAKTPLEVSHYMQAADMLCVSSDNEGLPNVILEAFACGLPVVSRNVGGISEILTNDSLGELVDSNQPQKMASAMAKALSKPVQPAIIHTHAQWYSWKKTAARYFELLQTAAKNRGTFC